MSNRGRTRIWITVGAFSVLVPLALLAYEYGPDPRYTGAPGDNQLACAASGCHTGLAAGGPINAAGGAVNATFSSGTTYTPGGAPITITVSVTDPVNLHYGFQMTARLESNLTEGQAGNFTAGMNQIVICDDNSLKPVNGLCPAATPVQFVEHSFPPGDSEVSTTPYSFTWTPPSTNVGNVHFYVAGNAVPGNVLVANGGDHVYTNNYVLTPAAAAPTCTNTSPVSIMTVNSATDFGGWSNFASGSYIEIKGSNLAPAGDSRTWTGTDFNGNNAPTTLDGVSVSINGKSAFVYYISPTQIDAVAPDDSTTGGVPITVTNCQATSNSMTVTKTALAAGMQAPASFLVNGTQYMVALITDSTLPLGYAFVGNTNLSVSPYFYRPANPGQSITAYGLGFGPVTPTNPTGVITTASNSIVSSDAVTIFFGTTPAAIAYAGLAPGFVDLYQFNITVPSTLANGDYPITVKVGGTAITQTMSLTVHN
jgi:uncharacterized protein (TIGR03437 family)